MARGLLHAIAAPKAERVAVIGSALAMTVRYSVALDQTRQPAKPPARASRKFQKPSASGLRDVTIRTKLECIAVPNQFSRMSLDERLLRSVQYEANTGCWLWAGAVDGKGYGRLIERGKVLLAHRVSWMICHGAIPSGLCVCHRCDTPLCVNPAHLFLGTQRENIQDASRKQRMPLGERQGNVKLKTADVIAIRELAHAGVMQKDIAARFAIAQPTVSDIVRRKKWPHV